MSPPSFGTEPLEVCKRSCFVVVLMSRGQAGESEVSFPLRMILGEVSTGLGEKAPKNNDHSPFLVVLIAYAQANNIVKNGIKEK